MAARSKRTIAVTGLLAIFLVLLFITTLKSSDAIRDPTPIQPLKPKSSSNLNVQNADLTGHAIMPKLGNETAKAELGRAAWKLLHTTMARFPDEPTKEESAALEAYLHLFQRLYPCGECAEHFGKIITKFPPQVASRSTAAAWACHVHNEVNKSLDKPIFDCSNIGDFYDCGCADGEEEDSKTPKKSKTAKDKKGTEQTMEKGSAGTSSDTKKKGQTTEDDKFEKPEMSAAAKERLSGEVGRDFNEDVLLPKLKEEGYGRGG